MLAIVQTKSILISFELAAIRSKHVILIKPRKQWKKIDGIASEFFCHQNRNNPKFHYMVAFQDFQNFLSPFKAKFVSEVFLIER